MPQQPGVPDHAAPSSPRVVVPKVSNFLTSARKAWAGFLVAGGASAIAQNLATLNFSTLGLQNLYQGLVGGVLTGFVVYWVTNGLKKYGGAAPPAPASEPMTQNNPSADSND